MNKIKLTDDQVNALYMAGHDGECLGDAYESTLNEAIKLGIVRPSAADSASGEEVVYTNATTMPIEIGMQLFDDLSKTIVLQPGKQLVVRKVRGNG